MEQCEREETRAWRTSGEDDEPAAGTARAGIRHQRHTGGGASDELQLPQIEHDQRSVVLGRP